MTENKNYQQPDVQDPENNELEINWMEILRKIITIRKTLYKAAGVGVGWGIIIALSIPNQYTVTVTLSPEMGGDKASGGLASLASSFLGGTATGSSSDALNVTLAPDIVTSTPFILELFNTRVQTLDGKLDTTLVAYLDEQKSPWFSYIVKAPNMAIKVIKSFLKEEADTISSLNPFQLTEEEYQKLVKRHGENSSKLKEQLRKYRRTKKFHFQMNSGKLKFSTIQSFKGWEVENIFLIINLNNPNIKDLNNISEDEIIYTGISRAKKNLIILEIGESKYTDFFKLYLSSQNIFDNKMINYISFT